MALDNEVGNFIDRVVNESCNDGIHEYQKKQCRTARRSWRIIQIIIIIIIASVLPEKIIWMTWSHSISGGHIRCNFPTTVATNIWINFIPRLSLAFFYACVCCKRPVMAIWPTNPIPKDSINVNWLRSFLFKSQFNCVFMLAWAKNK